MVTSQQIAEYLAQVPPMPETLRNTLAALEKGELAEAARAAASDEAMVQFLRRVVNSAAYGFRNELKDTNQIFSALGVERAKQLLYAYMVTLLAPKTWRFFRLDGADFTRFQTDLMRRWEKILRHEGADERFLSAAAIESAGLAVADAIFGDHAEDVALLQQNAEVDLDTILEKVAGMRFDRLLETVAEKWEVEEDVAKLVRLSFAKEPCDENEPVCRLARMLHLLLFYELSRPALMAAGANAFVSFEPEFVAPVMESFEEAVGLE